MRLVVGRQGLDLQAVAVAEQVGVAGVLQGLKVHDRAGGHLGLVVEVTVEGAARCGVPRQQLDGYRTAGLFPNTLRGTPATQEELC